MALIDQFKKLYDKIKPLTNTHISEQDPQASLRHVEVQLTSSDYICYDQNLTKGKLGLENLSSSLMKNECDGIIISEKGNIALHFVELKSNIDTHDIDKAIKIIRETAEEKEVVTSPVDGLLFTLREYPVVYPGSLLARVLKQEVTA